jgi:hypothetical protein
MRVTLRHGLPLLLIPCLASCTLLRGTLGESVPRVEGTSTSIPKRGKTPTSGLERKRVTGKQAPNLLLAHDGTSCAVTEERYRDVEVGDHEVCPWQ